MGRANITVGYKDSKMAYDTDREAHRTFEQRQEELDLMKSKEEERQKLYKKTQNNSPFDRFIQINKDTYQLEDKLMQKNPLAYRIWRFLINEMDNYNAIQVSSKVLEEMFCVSRSTISRAITTLRDGAYISILKSGTSNIYTLNHDMVWNSWGRNLRYSKFQANIIIGESEQDKEIQEHIKRTRKKIKTERSKKLFMEKEEPIIEPTEEQYIQDEVAQELYEEFEENFISAEEQDIEDML